MFFFSRSMIVAISTPGNLKSFVSLLKSKLGIFPEPPNPNDEFVFSSAIVSKVAVVFNERSMLPQCFRKARSGYPPAVYLTRRPLKKPLLVVFCLMLAVSPCLRVFMYFRLLVCRLGIIARPFVTSIGRRHRRL